MTNRIITVVGAGAWGNALALLLARNQQVHTRMWCQETALMHELSNKRINERYLPGISFPDSLEVNIELDDALHNATDLLIAIPSDGFYEQLQQIKQHPAYHSKIRIAWASKGFDGKRQTFLHQVVEELLGHHVAMAILAGPSFAAEVAHEIPTAVSLAANHQQFADDLYRWFYNDYFSLELTDDIVGVQIGGIFKNIYAIAAGMIDGLGYGANTRSALITYCLRELTQFAEKINAKTETLYGLSGLGDLILTCTDDQSRNRRFGLAMGRGKTAQQALQEINATVEGLSNAPRVYAWIQQQQIHMPIIETVHQIIAGQQSLASAINYLFTHHFS